MIIGPLLRLKIIENITGNILTMDKINSGNIYGTGVRVNV